MCNDCRFQQYCEDCKAETPLFARKPSRSRVFIRKNEGNPRVTVSGDVVYIKGRPFQLNRNIEIEVLEGKKDIFALTKDKKVEFHFRKHCNKILLIKRKEKGEKEIPNKKPKPTEILFLGKIDSEVFLNLANGLN